MSGATRFHSAQTPRSGQLVALGHDVLDLAGAAVADAIARFLQTGPTS